MQTLPEAKLWHPVTQACELGPTPLAVHVLERALVLWRDGAQTVHAWADQCPHRGAKLSLGRVCEGWLGSRATTGVADYAVQTTPTGLLATGCKAWQPQGNVHSTAPAEVEYTYEVTAPHAAVLQDFQHTIFMQDKPVLESQSPKCVPLDPRQELHTVADRASSAYRRFLKQSSITFGAGP